MSPSSTWIDLAKETVHAAKVHDTRPDIALSDEEDDGDEEDTEDEEDTHSRYTNNGSPTENVLPMNTPYTYLWRRSCLTNIYHKFKMNVPRDGIKAEFYNWALTGDICNMTLEPGKRHPLRYAGLVYSQFYSSTKEIFATAKTNPFADSSLGGLAIDPSLHEIWEHAGGYRGKAWSARKVRQVYLAGKARISEAL